MPRNTVALGIRGPDPAASGGTATNPLQMGLDIMRMRQLQNENQAFQLHQQGLIGAGEIMSRHPNDEEGGLRELMSSPYAPYVPEFTQAARQGYLALTQAHEAQARTGTTNLQFGDTALKGYIRGLAPYASALQSGNASEEQLNGLLDNAANMTIATTAGGTDAQRAQAVLAVNAVRSSLTGSPAERLQKLQSLIGSTLDAPAIGAILGDKFEVRTNAGTYTGYSSPITGPRYTSIIPETAAPGYQEAGRFLQGQGPPTSPSSIPAPLNPYTGQPQVGFPTIGGAIPSPAGNALGGQAQPLPVTPPVGQGGPTMQPIIQRPDTGPVGWDGKPLYSPKTDWGTPPEMQVGTGGERRLTSETDRGLAKNAADDFTGPEAKAYGGFQNTLGQLQFMDADLDRMAGTPVAPGAYGDRRLQIGNMWNTAFDTLHSAGLISDDALKSMTFDRDLLAAGESFTKAQTLAQFATTVQNFGSQREAAQIIMRSLTAVPNMNNTVMGDKLVLEGLRAIATRGMEYRDFQPVYAAHHSGSLAGADIAFNKEHPIEGYIQPVLDKFGLSNKGFNTRGDILNAVQHGWIDSDKQAPMFFKQLQDRETRQQIQSP